MMPPKMKKSNYNWIVCEICNMIMTLKDQQLHVENSCLIQREKLLLHPFIRDQVLYTSLEELSSDGFLNGIPIHENWYNVFMLESAMQLCNISIGSHVLIKSYNQSIIRVAWPMRDKTSTSVLMTVDGIEQFGEKTGTQLSIERLKPPPSPAAIIAIEPSYPSSKSYITVSLLASLPKVFLGKVLMEGNTFFLRHLGRRIHFKVVGCYTMQSEKICDDNNVEKLKNMELNDDFVARSFIVYAHTKFEVYSKSSMKVDTYSIHNVGGLADVIEKLREFLELAFNPYYRDTGSKRRNGCLLFGPMGCGKTLLAKCLIAEFPVTFLEINGSEVYSKYFGEAESKLRALFHLAIQRSPSVIFMDEIDALCPNMESNSSHQESRVIATLISLLDNLQNETERWNSVVVIGATSHLSALDHRLRCPGRLDLEIEVTVPQSLQRLDILQKIAKQWHKRVFLEDETVLSNVANVTHGYVGADLASICLHAVSSALKRKDCSECSPIPVQAKDFQWALSQVKPTAMREVLIEVPNVCWSDIGGQYELKLKLRQAVEWPLHHPESFKRLGVSPPKGLLMFGPPGCSKTMIAKALANESGLNFISIKGPELFSKWVGESEKAVREVFRRARQVAPAVIFFDELDALGGERGANSGGNVHERVLSQLLTEMDGVAPLVKVTVVAATNRPDRIDKALLRPGRLDQIIYVPLPDADTRREILALQFKKSKFSEDVSLQEIIFKTDGYSGAEVLAVCHEAGLIALEEDINAPYIERRHVDEALSIVKPRTPQSLLSLYEKYLRNR